VQAVENSQKSYKYPGLLYYCKTPSLEVSDKNSTVASKAAAIETQILLLALEGFEI